jgi:hypothetical protein
MGATRQKGMRAQRAAELARNVPMPLRTLDGSDESSMALETGQEIAWVMKSRAGVTVGVSAIHRVFGGGRTYCSHQIPDEPQRIPPLPSLDVCSTCDRLWKRATAEEARAERVSA